MLDPPWFGTDQQVHCIDHKLHGVREIVEITMVVIVMFSVNENPIEKCDVDTHAQVQVEKEPDKLVQHSH